MSVTLRSTAVAAALAALVAAPGRAPAADPAPPAGPRQLDLPPITGGASPVVHPGKLVWFDLLTHDPELARTFYGALLGWTFESRGEYTLARDAGGAVAGIIRMAPPGAGKAPAPSRWMPLLSVSDLAAAIEAVKANGGRVVEGPGSLGARGRYAAVADPRGAQFVLLSSATGDPPDADGPPPGWMWGELWTDDLQASARFYRAVLGYEVWEVGAGKNQGFLLASEGRPRARAARTPFEKVGAQWVPYVVVLDLRGALTQATRQGGRVLRRAGKELQLAAVADPDGAVMILEQRPAGADQALKGPATPPPAGAAGAAAAAGATGPTADAYGIEAAQEKSAQEAAARADQAAAAAAGAIPPGGADLGATAIAPAPYANIWLAPPAWGLYWGPGWAGPPGWVGPSWWGAPGWWGPYYRPPPYYGPRPPAPGYPGAYPRGAPAPPRYGPTPAPGARPAPAPPRAAPRSYAPPAPRAGSAPAPRAAPAAPRAAPAPAAPRSAPPPSKSR